METFTAEYIINPNTGRKVRLNTRTYRRLLRGHNEQNNRDNACSNVRDNNVCSNGRDNNVCSNGRDNNACFNDKDKMTASVIMSNNSVPDEMTWSSEDTDSDFFE